MKVYHGGTVAVKNPDLNVLRFDTDFGKGFYTTTDYEQAKNWSYSKKRKLIRNGVLTSNHKKSPTSKVGG